MIHEDQIEFYTCPLCGRGTGNDIDGPVDHECEEEKRIRAKDVEIKKQV